MKSIILALLFLSIFIPNKINACTCRSPNDQYDILCKDKFVGKIRVAAESINILDIWKAADNSYREPVKTEVTEVEIQREFWEGDKIKFSDENRAILTSTVIYGCRKSMPYNKNESNIYLFAGKQSMTICETNVVLWDKVPKKAKKFLLNGKLQSLCTSKEGPERKKILRQLGYTGLSYY